MSPVLRNGTCQLVPVEPGGTLTHILCSLVALEARYSTIRYIYPLKPAPVCVLFLRVHHVILQPTPDLRQTPRESCLPTTMHERGRDS